MRLPVARDDRPAQATFGTPAEAHMLPVEMTYSSSIESRRGAAHG